MLVAWLPSLILDYSYSEYYSQHGTLPSGAVITTDYLEAINGIHLTTTIIIVIINIILIILSTSAIRYLSGHYFLH